ncbi:MAG TPA: hypothetical protein VK601_25710, partial [Kofleriaceae bacterium]|nr:hypothetical protein [Kofleriaceae bacterium]
MTNCPACDNVVDPLRSRFVGVRAGRVVAYCSAACAAGGVATPTAIPERTVTPATGVPRAIPTPPAGVPSRAQTPARGVPSRAQTPASGVPVRASVEISPRTRAAADAAGPPRPVTPPPGVPIDADSGPVIEILHEPASGVVTSARDARSE